MNLNYLIISKYLKIISDPKRLQIIDMLSCGEMCACEILDYFNISQPTLSYDMKLLTDNNLVKYRKSGKNIYYSLNLKEINEFYNKLGYVFKYKDDCICKKINNSSND